MANVVLPQIGNMDAAIGGLVALSVGLAGALDEILTFKGREARSCFDTYKKDFLQQYKNMTMGTGSFEGEATAIGYGVQSLEAVFAAMETQFDGEGNFQSAKKT